MVGGVKTTFIALLAVLLCVGGCGKKEVERVSLSPEISGELASQRPTDPLPSSLVLPNGIPRMRELKKDLDKAKIVYCDDKGRYADFHALRHTCATHMLKNGVSAILVKKHMRHSDLKLTTNCYTDQDQLDVSGALQALPSHQAPSAQICAQILGADCPLLAQVIESWPTLSPATREAIRTIAKEVSRS